MDDDYKEDQLNLSEPEKRGTDNGGKIHQHHDAIVVDQESDHISQENFVMADIFEGLTEVLERN